MLARVAILIAFSIQLSSSSSPFQLDSKPCESECPSKGNCNAEYGTCECPWPLRGTKCQTNPLSLCYDSPEAEARGTHPGCGKWSPKSCACYQQCQELWCANKERKDWWNDPWSCRHENIHEIGESRCWILKDKSASQTSYCPAKDTADWYKVPGSGPYSWSKEAGGPGVPPDDRKLDPKEHYHMRNDQFKWLVPVESCDKSCHHHGFCVRWEPDHDKNQHQFQCICRKGFTGPACDQLDPNSCWFSPNCSGRGTCKSGFCHCEKGYWGIDCSRSKAYSIQAQSSPDGSYSPSKTILRIYMYDLPSDVAFTQAFDDGGVTIDMMYGAFEFFLQQFLNDWTVRTENPYEANLFYIPALLYFHAANVRNPTPHMKVVVDYISKFPWWKRRDGRDHFFFMTGDQGSCFVNKPEHFLSKPIKLVHFGLHGQGILWDAYGPGIDQRHGCIRPQRDVVVPPVVDSEFVRSGKASQLYEKILAGQGEDGLNRSILFFFAGGVHFNQMNYSGGARQALFTHLHSLQPPPDDVVVSKTRLHEYEAMFLRSKFCVAPHGAGWGLRLSWAMANGCIPVIIQNQVFQPFEELLPYEEFSVRLGVKDVPKIIPLLRSYDHDRLKQMRLAMAKYWKAFIWHSTAQGTAYNWTIRALKRRLHNLESEYY